MNKLIIWLIRKKFNLKKDEPFQFANQKDKTTYYTFTDNNIIKYYSNGKKRRSGVSLNYLLDNECKIIRGYFNL